jgi:hypothetical protein
MKSFKTIIFIIFIASSEKFWYNIYNLFSIIFLSFLLGASGRRHKKCYPISEACKGENQEFSPTEARCQRNCNNLEDAFQCAPKAGCVCKKGYVRSKDNKSKCIKVDACPKRKKFIKIYIFKFK